MAQVVDDLFAFLKCAMKSIVQPWLPDFQGEILLPFGLINRNRYSMGCMVFDKAVQRMTYLGGIDD